MNTPNIRFKGYTDAWEQRKLGDILHNRKIMMKQNNEYHRLAFAAGQGIIEIKDRKTNNRDQLIKDEFDKKYLVTELNDIVYNPANLKYGAIDRNKLGKGLISPIYVTFITDQVPGFIERIVVSKRFKEKALHFEEGSVTKRQSVNPSDLLSLEEYIAPKLKEQEQIGTYFDNLDNLITLYQRKCDEITSIKKYMLQKMFPKQSEKVPEIRFPGFSGDWEQHKVSDVTSVDSFKLFLNEASDDGKFEVIQQGDKPILGYADGQPFIDYEKVTLFGDHTLSLYKPKSPFFVASDGLKILYSDNMDGLFYYYMLIKYKPKSEGYKRHFSILKDCLCSYPIDKEEQIKIGQYFDELDSLITLYQQERDKYRELKKGLLQQMFI